MPNRWTAISEQLTRFGVWLLFFSVFCSASGIAVATAFVGIFGVVAYWNRLRDLPKVPLFWPLLALAGALALSMAANWVPGFGKPLGKLRYLFFYFPLVLFFAQNPQTRTRLARAAIPFAVALGVIAAFQFSGKFCPLLYLGATSVPLAEVIHSGGYYFHARGLLYHHNPFAYTSLLLYYLLLGQALTASSGRQLRWSLVGIAALLPAIALSGSRGSWVSLAVSSVFVFGFVARRHWKGFAALSALVLVLGFALSGPLGDRFQSIRPSQNPERLRLWEISWQMFVDRPLLGQGYHYGFELQRERFMNAEEKTNPHFPTDPHSLYFDLLATTGIVGTGAFLYLLVAAYLSYGRALCSKNLRKPDRAFLITGLGAWICFTVGTAFDSHFFHTQTLMATVFFLALGQSVCLKQTALFR